jgi:DNA mismatch endonuclease (patch repair protein)
MDVLSREERHRCMSAIRGQDTEPEIRLRKALHALGYRYRLHVASLPGKPDLVFVAKKKVVFVHGCFWHRHTCKSGRSVPATRKKFWSAKLQNNALRDRRNARILRKLGWTVLVVWECQLVPTRIRRLLSRVTAFLK